MHTYLVGRHNIHDSPWTPERVELLATMWGQGYSASQIAAQFNGSKITRSAVIGKAHRLKLPAREERKTDPRKPRPRRSPRPPKWRPPETKPLPPPAPTPPHMRKLGIFKLRPHMCRWPLGELLEPAKLFCAADVDKGEVYCPFHKDQARVPDKRRKADEYNGNDDFGKSIDWAYRAIRERKAKGGPGWGGWE